MSEQMEMKEVKKPTRLTLQQQADIAGVSVTTMKRGNRVIRLGGEEMKNRLIAGEINIPQAERELGIASTAKYPKRFTFKWQMTLQDTILAGDVSVHYDSAPDICKKVGIPLSADLDWQREGEDWDDNDGRILPEFKDFYTHVEEVLASPVTATITVIVDDKKPGEYYRFSLDYITPGVCLTWLDQIQTMCCFFVADDAIREKGAKTMMRIHNAILHAGYPQVYVTTDFKCAYPGGCGRLADVNPEYDKYSEVSEWRNPKYAFLDVDDSEQTQMDL